MRIPQLREPCAASLVSSPTNSRAFAVHWLLACLMLLVAAMLHAQSNRDWYQAALAGLVLSQVLILFVWRDAKFGTIANVLVLLPVLLGAAQARFSIGCERESVALMSESRAVSRGKVQLPDLARLPPPVQRWLDRAGVIGRPLVSTVRLRQQGEIRVEPGGAWLPATAEQYFSVASPGYVWRVETRMFSVLPVVGRDEYRAGTGSMLIKAAALIRLVDAKGAKIDSGAMQRFLGEMVWFPSAALGLNVTWSVIDARTARATLADHGRSVDVDLEFDDIGRVTAIRAQRFMGGGTQAMLTPWEVSCTAWKRFAGVEVPVVGEVGWRLSTGYFSYYRWRILDVEYDRNELFGELPSSIVSTTRDFRRPRADESLARKL
jgi:hypothetical protein